MSVDCVIYSAERIVLTCTVSSEGISDSLTSLDSSSININWFFNNGTEYELMVGTNVTRSEDGNGSAIIISSTLAVSGITQEDIAPLAPGSYYCRVNVALTGEDVVSNFSQQFIVMDQDNYLQFTTNNCSNESFIANESSCAIRNQSIAVVNPTTLIPRKNTPMPTDSIYENLTKITTNHASVTDVTSVQDTTIQSSPDQSDGVPEIWIYILGSMMAVFLIIIIILIVIVLRSRLVVRKSDPQLQRSNNIDRKSYSMLLYLYM